MEQIEEQYSSFVHVNNGGFVISVESDVVGGYFTQRLTTSLDSFGMPHSTSMWIDDNVLDALEYIITKAREQREALRAAGHTSGHALTNPAMHSGEVSDGG